MGSPFLYELWRQAPAKRTPDNRYFGLVSQVDILGFSSVAWKIPASELKSKLEYTLNFSKSASENPIGTPPRQFIKFQDTMFRCTEIGYANDGEGEEAAHLAKWYFTIIDEIASLRDIQLNFVGEGVLLRGAMAIGSYDIVEGTVFGPTVLKVLEMEKSIAIFPRIIIDETISGFLDYIPPSNITWFNLNLRTDKGGTLFIDYLRGAAFEAPWDLYWYAKALEKHKFSLDRLTYDRPRNPDVAKKLVWLVNYHNEVVTHLSTAAPRNWELDWDSFLVNPG